MNEFQFVIDKIQNKELPLEIMKKHLYNRADEKSFFYALDKHLFSFTYLENYITDTNNCDKYSMFKDLNNIVQLILPACYFGHLNVLKWLLNNGHDINSKNGEGENGLHLGNRFCYSS